MRPWSSQPSLGRAVALAALVLQACDQDPRAPSRLRLWCDVPSELEEAAPTAIPRTVFASAFERDLEGWRGVVNPGRESGGMKAELAREGERAFVRLTGTHGGLNTIVPVAPSTCYVFTALARSEGIASDREAFDGARFWLAEATEATPFEEFRTTESERMRANWTSASAANGEGWRSLRYVFVTSPETHALYVLCSLATLANVSAGAASFADLSLEEHPLETYWRAILGKETAARAQIDPRASGRAAERRVSAELGGEHRPALVLLPGERLRFRLPHRAGEATLSFGAGEWAAATERKGTALAGGGANGAGTKLRVRSGSRELLCADLPRAASALAARWLPCELPLGNDASELELALEGRAPAVIGAPVVAPAGTASERPNVLLVSIDTLRADRLDEGSALAPHLRSLARTGLWCRDASTQAPYTLPAHTSLLTGQFPSVHGVVATESTLSAARSTTLAECLARAGYATRAFTAGGFVNSVFGLDQGFEAFSEIDPIRAAGSHYARTLERKHGPELARALLEEQGFPAVERWLRAHGSAPFFLFLHTYTVHDYDTPARFLPCAELGCTHPKVTLRTRTAEEAAAFTSEMRAHVEHLYDAALRYTDERLGTLFALLAELGLAERTLIVVTSDHGEEFFEHGALQHGRTLYQELLAVPLLLAGPGVPARTLERPAMLVDVVPTILARLSLPCPPHVQGVDLLGPDWPARALWSEVDDSFAHKYALRDEEGAKTIHGPTEHAVQFPNASAWEHFDLARDPREGHALLAPEAARARLLRQRAALEELGRSLGARGAGALDAGMRQELDELGYAGE